MNLDCIDLDRGDLSGFAAGGSVRLHGAKADEDAFYHARSASGWEAPIEDFFAAKITSSEGEGLTFLSRRRPRDRVTARPSCLAQARVTILAFFCQGGHPTFASEIGMSRTCSCQRQSDLANPGVAKCVAVNTLTVAI
jgi:hypothetical protein